MEDWRHHSPHLRLQHRRDGQDAEEEFGRYLKVGEGNLQVGKSFRHCLIYRKPGKNNLLKSSILILGQG